MTRDETHAPLSAAEAERYSRQIRLPEIGVPGQLRLKESAVLVVGAGGLGSPASLHLAAAGVGRLAVIDSDRVEPSNLHRQILHSDAVIGAPKAISAAERLQALNPYVAIEPLPIRFLAANARALVRAHDLVVDASDNFATRYAIADACALEGKPHVFGSVDRFGGQVTVFDPPRGPCYRCLFPEPPPPEVFPSCSEAGVLGVVPGIVGTLQAAEALKLLLGLGQPLRGRLLRLDVRRVSFGTLEISHDPGCRLCGPGADIDEVREMNDSCRDVPIEISPRELKDRLSAPEPPLLLDVREPEEVEVARIGGKVLPLRELQSRVSEIPSGAKVVVLCHHGVRSLAAARWLRANGFPDAQSVAGGIDRWSREVDPGVPRY